MMVMFIIGMTAMVVDVSLDVIEITFKDKYTLPDAPGVVSGNNQLQSLAILDLSNGFGASVSTHD